MKTRAVVMVRAPRYASIAFAFAAVLGGAACTPAKPAASADGAASAKHTSVDAEKFSLDVPGEWDQRPTREGVELVQGEHDQIMVSVLDAPNARALDLTDRVAQALRTAISQVCKRDGDVSASERIRGALPGVRFHLTCAEPQTVGTFVVASSEDKVVTYEHYRYAGTKMSADLDAADQAILDTLQFKAKTAAAAATPAPAPTPTKPGECPAEILAAVDQAATQQGGACLDSSILGDATTKTCVQALQKKKWKRDKMTESAITAKTGKKLACYKKP